MIIIGSTAGSGGGNCAFCRKKGRDVHYFNLAMLVKKVWRLLKNHKSLCVRVL